MREWDHGIPKYNTIRKSNNDEEGEKPRKTVKYRTMFL